MNPTQKALTNLRLEIATRDYIKATDHELRLSYLKLINSLHNELLLS